MSIKWKTKNYHIVIRNNSNIQSKRDFWSGNDPFQTSKIARLSLGVSKRSAYITTYNRTFVEVFVCLFYLWGKPEDPEKTTDLSQVIDKLYHIMLYTSPWSRFELPTSVVICTDCIDSCKSNNHTIKATTAFSNITNDYAKEFSGLTFTQAWLK
jgi:hypothetical protein